MKTRGERERLNICIRELSVFWKLTGRKSKCNPHPGKVTGSIRAEEVIDLPGRNPEKFQTRNGSKNNN